MSRGMQELLMSFVIFFILKIHYNSLYPVHLQNLTEATNEKLGLTSLFNGDII